MESARVKYLLASLCNKGSKDVFKAMELSTKGTLNGIGNLVHGERLVVDNIDLVRTNKLVKKLRYVRDGSFVTADDVALMEAHAKEHFRLA